MPTSTLQTLSSFTATNGLQPNAQTPAATPIFTDATPTQSLQPELLLPANGVSVPLPIPSYWSQVTQVQVVNTDTSGYCVLTLNATFGTPVSIGLAPNGGTFATSIYATTVTGGTAATPKTWTLQSMSSGGTTSGAAACNVLIYIAGY